LSDKDWIRSKPTGLKYVIYAILRFFYRLIPDAHFTLATLLVAVFQIVLVALISFVPVIFELVIAPRLGIVIPKHDAVVANPYYQALLLFILQVAKFALDRLKANAFSRNERMKNLLDLCVALDATVGVIERQIAAFANGPVNDAEINSFLQHALKCIESTVRLCTEGVDDRFCCVTLMTFEAGGRIQIRARSRIERPIGKIVPQEEAMAYLAAKFVPDYAVVHNFKLASWFKKALPVQYRSLSSLGKPKYESILFLPLPPVSVPNGNQIRKAVVTIDAARPYEFLGKEIDILIRVQAYLHVINMMLVNHGVGVEQELT
jgi:hypothetical protein